MQFRRVTFGQHRRRWCVLSWHPRPPLSPIARRDRPAQHQAGFTLVEVLVVLLIIGILSAIMATGWNEFLLRQNLKAAQDSAFSVMREAQQTAIVQRSTRQASFRQNGDRVEWAVHDRDTPLAQAPWELLSTRVALDPAETTLQPVAGAYRVRFDYKGRVSGRLGRLTFMGRRASRQRRCVFVSTLLGVLRRGENQATPDRGGRYCY